MLAIIAPGQGSQSPGFLTPWLAQQPLADLLATWSDEISLDLIYLGTKAGAEEIRLTSNAQPLIVAAGLLGAKALGEVEFSLTAGHSVGEITAAALSGVIGSSDAMGLVRERGIAMQIAASSANTGMSAILGGERDEVIAAITALGLVAANENGAGQIVAAGDLVALEKLAQTPPPGARVRALAVAGAFHSSYMQSAVPRLGEYAHKLSIRDPQVALLSNRDGERVKSGEEFMERLVAQVANPVRWDLCMATMKRLGVTAVIELPPAGTLVGLLKRAIPEIETVALKTPADLVQAQDLISRHSEKSSQKVAP